ncbi:MAG: CpsB/CapC family capsule biosynthesis tyrosine phosphatase, partial [bacterium]
VLYDDKGNRFDYLLMVPTPCFLTSDDGHSLQRVRHTYYDPDYSPRGTSVEAAFDASEIYPMRVGGVNAVLQVSANGTQLTQSQINSGAEVYYFTGIGDADKMHELTIAGSDILLLEMPFAQWNEDVYQDVKKIIYEQGLRVVLAHLERYFEFQKNKDSWTDILNLPVTVQLNAGCAFERKKRKFALKVLDSDLPAVLGSDCHNLTSRRPNLDIGRAALEKSVGAARMARMDAEAEALLTRIPGWASGSFK